jgi:hypothetical protein
MEAISTQGLYLVCVGGNLFEDVKSELKLRYPTQMTRRRILKKEIFDGRLVFY